MPNLSGTLKIAIIFLPLFVLTAQVGAETQSQTPTLQITKNLSLGMKDTEIISLQKILNQTPETRIAQAGPGSPGNETDYFGNLTLRAVARFQELNREEILVPSNLSAGNGFVGPATRKVLNKKQASTKVDDVVKGSPTIPLTGFTYIISPDKYAELPGTKITLTGVGFTSENNTLFFGKDRARKIEGLRSSNGTTLAFTLPDYPAGKYDLYIQNANGSSTLPSFIIIKSPKSEAPIIESVSPTSGPYGSKIVIKGKNFTATNNEVRTNYRIIENLPSPDGTTITVSMDLFPDVPQLQTGNVPKQNFTLPVYLFVLNSNGVSDRNNPGRFTLEL